MQTRSVAHRVEAPQEPGVQSEEALVEEPSRRLRALADSASLGASLGLKVHAGHGLTVQNVGAVAAIPEIEELNIGHSIVGRSMFVGLEDAVREIRRAMDRARGTQG